MFTKLFAYFCIFMGLLWVVNPGLLRNWFTRKANFKFFWFFLGLLFFSMIHVLGIVWQAKMPIVRSFGIAALILCVIIVWTAQSKARGYLTRWCQSLPLPYFQAVGVLNIALGVTMLLRHG
jgi:hypothetical protein